MVPPSISSCRLTKYKHSILMILGAPYLVRGLDVPQEIADNFDLLHSTVRKSNVGKLLFDWDEQFELIKPINAKLVTEVRFVCNLFGINVQVLGNKSTHFIGIKNPLWRGFCVHRFPQPVLDTALRSLCRVAGRL